MYLSSGVNDLDLIQLSMESQLLCECLLDGREIRVIEDVVNVLDDH